MREGGAMLDLLRSLEWSVYGACPICRQVMKHAPGCRLARAIRGLDKHLLRGFRLHEVKDGVAEYRGCVATSGMPAPVGTIALTEPSPPEPTVDEMAREMGLEFRDGQYDGVVDGDAVEVFFASEKYPPGPPVWLMWGDRMSRHPDVGDALRTIYREHKARQGDPPDEELGRALGRSVTKEEEPPTDPSALAAWLYARVVPGRTIAEIDEPVMRSKGTVTYCQIGHRPHDGVIQVDVSGTAACYPPQVGAKAATAALVRLLHPDGTVLWEAK